MKNSYMNQFRHLQQFTSVEDFDQNRSKVFYTIKHELSKGLLSVWNFLAQRSLDVPGVCWIKIETIMKHTGLSRSTVERAIRKFKKLGVMRVEETFRPKNGGDGANVYVFLKLGEGAKPKGRDDSEKPTESKPEPTKSASKSNSFKTNKTYINHSNVIVQGVPKTLQFYKAIFGQHLRTLWFRVNFAFKKLKIEVDKETREEIGRVTLETLKQYVMSNKSMPEEQQNKLAYTIAYNQLKQRVSRGEIENLRDFWKVNVPEPIRHIRKVKPEPVSSVELDALGVY
jgi:hypothetical protein